MSRTAKAEADFDFDLYGSFRAHLAVYEGDLGIQNNASRFGLEPGLTVGPVRIFGRAEFGVNLVSSNVHFNLDSNPSGGNQLEVSTVTDQQPITTRLGYMGVDMGCFGLLTFGKQWGVFYDIAKWTDNFWVFGGEGNPTYNAGTDGGLTGTGRAEMALAYRLPIHDLSLGTQIQLLGGDDQIVRSVAAVASYSFPIGLSIGAAYNYAFYDNAIAPALVAGWDGGDGQVVIGGIKLSRWGLTVAVTGSRSWNHEIVQSGDAPVVIATWGLEVLARYIWRERLAVELGYNQAQPIETDHLLHPDFTTQYLIFGGSIIFAQGVLLYAEGKYDLGYDVNGIPQPSVFTVGLRLGFSTKALFDRLFDRVSELTAQRRSERVEEASEQ